MAAHATIEGTQVINSKIRQKASPIRVRKRVVGTGWTDRAGEKACGLGPEGSARWEFGKPRSPDCENTMEKARG